jgi:hypothetical protein
MYITLNAVYIIYKKPKCIKDEIIMRTLDLTCLLSNLNKSMMNKIIIWKN